MKLLLKQYRALEANGQYTDAAAILINALGTAEERYLMKGIQDRQSVNGSISPADIALRRSLAQKYYVKITTGT